MGPLPLHLMEQLPNPLGKPSRCRRRIVPGFRNRLFRRKWTGA